MSAKAYLGQVRILRARERILQDQIDIIRAELEAAEVTLRSAWPDGQPHGTGVTDPVGEKAAADVDARIQEKRKQLMDQLTDIEVQLLRVKSDLYAKRMEIIETIGSIPDADCNTLLYMRYVKCETWEQIAVSMHFTYQWVAGPLHGKALALMEKVLELKTVDSN